METKNTESKEERLKQIIQKVDVKSQNVIIENKELKQRLELAQLDQQLAEEQAQQSSAELQVSQERLSELEELRKLNTELEESSLAEKAGLEHEIAELKSELEAVNVHAQSYEALKLESKKGEWKVKAAELESNIIKQGVTSTLKDIVEAPWSPLLDFLKVSVSSLVSDYGQGKISVSKLTEGLHSQSEKSIESFSLFENTNEEALMSLLSELAELKDCDEKDSVKVKLNQAMERRKLEAEKNKNTKPDTEASATLEANAALQADLEETQLRNKILENKLQHAQLISDELKSLKAWQIEAKEREFQSHGHIETLKKQLEKREAESQSQKRRNLPIQLIEQNHQNYVQHLQKTITYLSGNNDTLQLTPLPDIRPVQISVLVGNPRLRKLRKAASCIRFGETTDECKKLAIDQDIQSLTI